MNVIISFCGIGPDHSIALVSSPEPGPSAHIRRLLKRRNETTDCIWITNHSLNLIISRLKVTCSSWPRGRTISHTFRNIGAGLLPIRPARQPFRAARLTQLLIILARWDNYSSGRLSVARITRMLSVEPCLTFVGNWVNCSVIYELFSEAQSLRRVMWWSDSDSSWYLTEWIE